MGEGEGKSQMPAPSVLVRTAESPKTPSDVDNELESVVVRVVGSQFPVLRVHACSKVGFLQGQ